MPDNSPILTLPYIQPSQAQKHVTHNEALARLDVLVQLRVAGFDVETPPASPVDGETHALGAMPTGAWVGQNGKLATWRDGVWSYITPLTGWRASSIAGGDLRIWDGATWVLPAMGSDTASLLFQSDWTGHAEMGLSGGIDFAIKVSVDGNTWAEALRFDAASGMASGRAVQSDALDATAGRLMTVAAFGLGTDTQPPEIGDVEATGTASGFYVFDGSTTNAISLPGILSGGEGIIRVERGSASALSQTAWRNDQQGSGRWWRGYASGSWGSWRNLYDSTNIIAPVSESGGIPTGGVIERGSNGDGEYIRFADGTQMCTNANAAIATAPVPFVGTITKVDSDKLWIGTWF